AATSTFPIVHVTNPYLRKFSALVPNFRLPTEKTLTKQINAEVARVVDSVHALMQLNSSSLSVSCDIGTTRGMVNSYLAIAVHFYDVSARKLQSLALDVVPLVQRHTADYISEVVSLALERAGVDSAEVYRYITDFDSRHSR